MKRWMMVLVLCIAGCGPAVAQFLPSGGASQADLNAYLPSTNGTAYGLTLLNPVVGTNGITVQGYVEVPTTNVLIFTAVESQYWPDGTNWNGEYHLRPDNVYSNSANGKVWRFTGWTGPKSPSEPTTWMAGWHDGSGLAWWANQYNPQLSEEGTGTVEGEPGFETYTAPTNTPTVAPWGSGQVNIGPGGSGFTIARGTTQELTTVTLTYDWATAIAAVPTDQFVQTNHTGDVTINGSLSVTGVVSSATGTAPSNVVTVAALQGQCWQNWRVATATLAAGTSGTFTLAGGVSAPTRTNLTYLAVNWSIAADNPELGGTNHVLRVGTARHAASPSADYADFVLTTNTLVGTSSGINYYRTIFTNTVNIPATSLGSNPGLIGANLRNYGAVIATNFAANCFFQMSE